jgi:hypothetical protein
MLKINLIWNTLYLKHEHMIHKENSPFTPDIEERNMEKGRDANRFINWIYPLYIWIESEKDKRGK